MLCKTFLLKNILNILALLSSHHMHLDRYQAQFILIVFLPSLEPEHMNIVDETHTTMTLLQKAMEQLISLYWLMVYSL